jgi:hypothetical protein
MIFYGHSPKAAPAAQPWGECSNPVGILTAAAIHRARCAAFSTAMVGLYPISISFQRVIMIPMNEQPTLPTSQAASPVRRLLLAESCLVKSSGLKNNPGLHQTVLPSNSPPAFLQKILMSTGYRRGGLNVQLRGVESPDSSPRKSETLRVVFRISPETTVNVQP